MIQSTAFYLISALLIFSAAMVVTQRSIFTSALYLAGALSMVAGIFILLGADFLAAMQILLYVGGILVILVFAVMLSSVQQSAIQMQMNEQWIPSLLICVGIVIVILAALNRHPFASGPETHLPTTSSIGQLLLGELVLPFEAVSLVLLASLLGAVYFLKKETEKG